MPAASSTHPTQGIRTTKNAGAARHTSSAGTSPTDTRGRVRENGSGVGGHLSVSQGMGDLVLRHACGEDRDDAEHEREEARRE